mmetsp:Transcript_37571/g.64808  ORF Transcript_37571/g.64808 Transcript_37571/m.64808 type:complete len:183 (-) Transcript_37571:137-685(-)|eukprot:CAMPEP_0205922208 /NCGR_PEP_ID=MMETSP1325-20131115/14109_1 /ASSEMBLY_ACC=CAM_ASM_000708 /TAXON_ID=236786 /ORGANISM="Florenciella sp., Strain RCC1007" /LENGTH=182 /DNA_ID=CAMNT_0053290185 /DNA_START=34 /DNA_END=582 /DNA_ORIENTATION=+
MAARRFLAIALLLLAGDASAWSQISRRQALAKSFGAATAAAGIVTGPGAASAVGTCPKGAQNCFVGTFKAPDSKDTVTTLKSVLESYPQEGQNGVDGGGWKFVSESATNYKLEYKSSGKGNLAKFFNGGKPFTDDLELDIAGDTVTFRSASRVGDSDFGVNTKRVNWIAKELRAKGWAASDI